MSDDDTAPFDLDDAPVLPAASLSSVTVVLGFFAGTLEVRGEVDGAPVSPTVAADLVTLRLPGCVFDPRAACLRVPAFGYADVVIKLVEHHKRKAIAAIDDRARRYDTMQLGTTTTRQPRDYQTDALTKWKQNKGRGVVVLPTGAGKTEVALLAIADRQRAALVIAPTLDLVRQWQQALQERFDVDVGVVGGGEHTVLPLTVTTYDSAWAHMEHLGNRFGLVVFDEAHHLVSDSYALAARLCLAPYRLGLTATPERTDGKDLLLNTLVGPIVLRKEINELEAQGFLADYDTETIVVELSAEDRAAWEAARATYKAFLLDANISLGGPRGWDNFIKRAAGSREGRAALAAWRLQKRLAHASDKKLDVVDELIKKHPGQRTLIFTDDNATAFAVSRRFLVPVITHQTKLKERAALLSAFAAGSLPILSTSRVLNEGVDVPDAQVAIIISGTGSIREHVQRLGRILRPRPGKRAILYELVSANTGETFTSERRRDHIAYR
ncbi:MAG TPA: DEAD/DEAH box helicase family protein [Myxococcota bacterium]